MQFFWAENSASTQDLIGGVSPAGVVAQRIEEGESNPCMEAIAAILRESHAKNEQPPQWVLDLAGAAAAAATAKRTVSGGQQERAPPVKRKAVTKHSFEPGKHYALLSPDGKHVLQATERKSSRFRLGQGGLDFAGAMMLKLLGVNLSLPRFGGFSLQFGPATPGALQSSASKFTFSSSRQEEYRMHSDLHNDKMLFMLGSGINNEPREWVVWESDVPIDGDWEVLELMWGSDGGKLRLKGHEGQHVKWNGGSFVATYNDMEATEFVLREV